MKTEFLTSYFSVSLDGKIKLREDLKFRIKKLNAKSKTPIRAHSTDAGIDFYSTTNETIPPGGRRSIPTGIACAVPEGWSLILKDKSGLALNNGLHVMAGIIDSDYRGEVCVVIVNLSQERVDISEGQKIAQGLLIPVGLFDIVEVPSLEVTIRNDGGFGSTGLKWRYMESLRMGMWEHYPFTKFYCLDFVHLFNFIYGKKELLFIMINI